MLDLSKIREITVQYPLISCYSCLFISIAWHLTFLTTVCWTISKDFMYLRLSAFSAKIDKLLHIFTCLSRTHGNHQKASEDNHLKSRRKHFSRDSNSKGKFGRLIIENSIHRSHLFFLKLFFKLQLCLGSSNYKGRGEVKRQNWHTCKIDLLYLRASGWWCQ